MHWHADRSKNEMAQSLGWTAKTLLIYRSGGGGGHQDEQSEDRTGVGGAGGVLIPAEKHHDYITAQLRAGAGLDESPRRSGKQQGRGLVNRAGKSFRDLLLLTGLHTVSTRSPSDLHMTSIQSPHIGYNGSCRQVAR